MENKPTPETEQEKTAEQTSKKENKVQSFLTFLATVIVAYFLCTSVFAFHTIPSSSMEPTIAKNSFAVCWRLPYAIGKADPQYGEIISFKQSSGRILIKRVIGLPGDTISFEDGYVYRNGEKLDEPYVKEQGTTEAGKRDVYVVPEGCVFLMGDNRMHSIDCRYIDDPYIPQQALYAKELFSFGIPGSR